MTFAEPLTDPLAASTVVTPTDFGLTLPPLLTAAIAALEELHEAEFVTSFVEPSL